MIFFDIDEQKNKYDKYILENINSILNNSKNLNDKYINVNIDNSLTKEKVIEEICLHEVITKIYNELKK